MEKAEDSTVVPHRAKISSFTSRVLTGTLLFFLLCLAVFSPAEAAGQNNAFERSGIYFPGGFDLNTVGDLRGKVTSISRPSGSGPVIINVETKWEKYAVVTCPPWYWDELKVKVTSGEEVHVIGSKSLGRDSNLYIVAQEIQFIGQGKSFMLRSKIGTPLWSRHRGQTDMQHGSGKRTRGQK